MLFIFFILFVQTKILAAEDNVIENKASTKTGPNEEPLFINVKDFGARGDGKTDDSEAIQKAFDRACRVEDWKRNNIRNKKAPRTVVFPAGEYRIVKTLVLDPRHIGLVIKGTGGAKIGNTLLFWDGKKGGNLIEAWGAGGFEIHDLKLDGKGKCGTLIRLNSIDGPYYLKKNEKANSKELLSYLKRFGQRATGENCFERLYLIDADIGMSLGDSSYICTSDMTFIDIVFRNCKTGFVTHSPQNMVYHFIRPNFLFCDTGLFFKKGGFVTCVNLGGSGGGIAIRIGSQGINNGVFNFTGVRVEAEMFKGKRTQMLLAEGAEANIKISSMIVTCQGLFGKKSDRQQPMFVVKNGVHVVVEDSFITGNVAEISGPKPSWMEFDNCRFRVLSDPRKIKCDENSGFEIKNCVVVEDEIDKNEKYLVKKTVMIEKFIKRPSHMIKALE